MAREKEFMNRLKLNDLWINENIMCLTCIVRKHMVKTNFIKNNK
jgi:hypothetical protein